MRTFEGVITQLDEVNDEARYKDALIYLNGEDITVESLDIFKPFKTTKGKFSVVIEIPDELDEEVYEEYELDLEPDEYLDNFTVVKNAKYDSFMVDFGE